VVPSPTGARQGWLNGVAVTSARNAWAVGFSGNATVRPMILRWNGSAWRRVKTPNGGGGARLGGVAATSATNAWAVGATDDGHTFIVHWNGSKWQRVPSPGSGTGAFLSGVAATSAGNAWAVGATGGNKILIVRWNGTAWKRVPTPGLPTGGNLERVTATSATSAWAVGYTASIQPLILRWNGITWRRVPAPRITGQLYGITALPGGGAWATGLTGREGSAAAPTPHAWAPGPYADAAPAKPTPLILRWNGRTWKRVASPEPPAGGALIGLTSTSASNAWAVGGAGSNLFGSTVTALVLHWNGHAWKPQKVTR